MASRGVEVQLHAFLTRTSGGELLPSHPQHPPSALNLLVHTVWAVEPVWTFCTGENILLLL